MSGIPGLKYLTKERLIELLREVPDGALIHPNQVGNLLAMEKIGDTFFPVGYIDFMLKGEWEEY